MSAHRPPSQQTTPHFFIIESLKLEDEDEERYEGKYLYNYLKMLGKNPKYYYIRSRRELEKISDIFRDTGYRYLYLSCHGNESAIYTTFDEIPFIDFASIFDRKLEHRRLFVSGCSVGRLEFAEQLFKKNGGMYSLTAPINTVFFNQTLPFWTAFYYLMESIDSKSMKAAAIYPFLQLCANIFNIDVIHFYKSTSRGGVVTPKEFLSSGVLSEEQMKKIMELYDKK